MKQLFIVHASSDKDSVARPIARQLVEKGFTVFYDEFSIKIGDSLRQVIERAVEACDYGVVILSRNFFEGPWPQYELDGLIAREMHSRRKVVLPVWHDVTHRDLVALAPSLSMKLAADTRFGIPFVVNMICEAIEADIGEVKPSVTSNLFGFDALRYVLCPQCNRPFKSPAFRTEGLGLIFLGPCPNFGYP